MVARSPLLQDITDKVKQSLKFVLLFSLASNLLMLFMPLYSLQVFDRVLTSYSVDTLVMLTLITVIGLLFFSVFYAIRCFITSRLGQWVDEQVAPVILQHTLMRSAQGLDRQGTQNMRDLQMIRGFITSPGLQTLLDAPWAPIFLLIVFMIHASLGVVTLVGGLLLLALAVATEWSIKRLSAEGSKHALEALKISDAANQNAESVEAMGLMKPLLTYWSKANEQMVHAQTLAANRVNILTSISKALRMILQVALMGVAALLAMDHAISAGGMIAASILSGRALAPFEAAIGLWKTVLSAKESYARLNDALLKAPPERGHMNLPTPKGELTAENVVYRPINGDRLILRSISFTIHPGEAVGLIGPSAAGKSTLAKTLVGILPPTSGKVRLDGVDVYQWNRNDIGQYIGYLPQQVELFHGTIKDNIARLQLDARDEDVVEAAQLAGAHELILRFPEGYETMVGPGISSLSHGQKQRIALARCFYGKPRLLILDEPNSNLDGEGERALKTAIENAKRLGITCIVIAHKPSLVTIMNRIMMVRDGMVEAFGPTDEILRRYVRPTEPA